MLRLWVALREQRLETPEFEFSLVESSTQTGKLIWKSIQVNTKIGKGRFIDKQSTNGQFKAALHPWIPGICAQLNMAQL